jgi:hypothetical protein
MIITQLLALRHNMKQMIITQLLALKHNMETNDHYSVTSS